MLINATDVRTGAREKYIPDGQRGEKTVKKYKKYMYPLILLLYLYLYANIIKRRRVVHDVSRVSHLAIIRLKASREQTYALSPTRISETSH